MNKPTFGSLTNPTEDILKEIKLFGEMGFDYVEIGIEGPRAEPDILMKKRAKILKLLKKYDMFAVSHTPYWADMGSNYENVRRGWINHLKKCIRVSDKFGISVMNLHASFFGMYFLDKKGKKTSLGNMVKSLRELVRYAKKYKIILVLENMPGKRMTEISDFKYVMKRVPGLKVHIDIGHCLCTGTRNTKNVEKWIKTFKKDLYHIHIHSNSGKGDEHLALGKGILDYIRIAKLLKKIGYDKTITFEVFTENRMHIKYSMNKLKKLF